MRLLDLARDAADVAVTVDCSGGINGLAAGQFNAALQTWDYDRMKLIVDQALASWSLRDFGGVPGWGSMVGLNPGTIVFPEVGADYIHIVDIEGGNDVNTTRPDDAPVGTGYLVARNRAYFAAQGLGGGSGCDFTLGLTPVEVSADAPHQVFPNGERWLLISDSTVYDAPAIQATSAPSSVALPGTWERTQCTHPELGWFNFNTTFNPEDGNYYRSENYRNLQGRVGGSAYRIDADDQFDLAMGTFQGRLVCLLNYTFGTESSVVIAEDHRQADWRPVLTLDTPTWTPHLLVTPLCVFVVTKDLIYYSVDGLTWDTWYHGLPGGPGGVLVPSAKFAGGRLWLTSDELRWYYSAVIGQFDYDFQLVSGSAN